MKDGWDGGSIQVVVSEYISQEAQTGVAPHTNVEYEYNLQTL